MSSFERPDGRDHDALRPIRFEVDFTKWAEGSVLCSFGDTRVLCTASVEDRVPRWMMEQRKGGWITAEYSMLPRATDKRTGRESVKGRIGGRTHEISRLIGRAIRAGTNMEQMGERTIAIDCDVLQADGGTRTAAITGAWLATAIAFERLVKKSVLSKNPMRGQIAAVSLGVMGDDVLLDLNYKEDQAVDTDLNLVMTSEGGFVEVQGTAEGNPFTRTQLDKMVDVGRKGIADLAKMQREALESWKAK